MRNISVGDVLTKYPNSSGAVEDECWTTCLLFSPTAGKAVGQSSSLCVVEAE